MPFSGHRYSPEEKKALIELARARGLKFNFTRFEDFLKYVQLIAPDILLVGKFSVPRQTPKPVRRASLYFNGERLYWQEEGNNTSWAAHSGTPEVIANKNYREMQSKADEGPIPEGVYLAPQRRFQKRPDDDLEVYFKGLFGRGTWRWGEKAWGNYRIWLEPESGTETFGRSGFTIHGGADPGSQGCIDLVGNMDAFARRFRDYEEDMYVQVQYP